MDRLFRRTTLTSFVLLWLLAPCAAAIAQDAATESSVVAAPVAPSESAEEARLAALPPSEALADTLNARKRYLAAIRTYESLPPTAPVLNKLGISCEHMFMFDKARASFLAAIKLNPHYAEAYNNLGTLAHSQGNQREAEKMYRKSLKLKPASASTLQNLGTLYYAERKFKKGDEAYRQALAIDPHIMEHSAHGIQAPGKANTASEVHYHLAMTYAHAGSQQLAIRYLQQAISEGFHDRNRLLHDKEFADIRTMPVFLQMVDDLKKD